MCSTNNLIYIRILQQDTEDQIRMGRTYPILQDNRVEYRNRDYKHIMWLGTHEEAEAKLNELGHRLHDMVCVVK